MNIKLLAFAFGLTLTSCITVVSPTPSTGTNVTGPSTGNRNTNTANNNNNNTGGGSAMTYAERQEFSTKFYNSDYNGDARLDYNEAGHFALAIGEDLSLIWTECMKRDWNRNGLIDLNEAIAAAEQ